MRVRPNSALAVSQPVRPGGSTLTFTLTSSNPASGDFAGSATITTSIAPGQSVSPNLSFRPAAAGSTTVAATSPGIVATAAASQVLTVTTPGITLEGMPVTVGAGLETGGLRRAILGASNHGGAVVRIESSNPSIALVSPNATTPGTAFFDTLASENRGQETVITTSPSTASRPGPRMSFRRRCVSPAWPPRRPRA